MIPRTDFFGTTHAPPEEPVTAFGFVLPHSNGSSDTARTKTRAPKAGTRLAYQSKLMNEMVRLATRFAKSSASVIITGESGTGKEIFSRLIHDESKRRDQRFVAVNCAAIPELLIESEIFGHERGAFTGAVQRRAGYFERADGGTLLLDEISEIPVTLQAKLLRAIEEHEIQPIGSDQPRQVNVRIVATTNRDLKTEVAEGRFRSDLYHRLNVLELPLPPLRERTSDIPRLVVHFLEMFQSECDHGIKQINKEAMKKLYDYHWPGNVRELRNVMHRCCVVATQEEITPDCLPDALTQPDESSTVSELLPDSALLPFCGKRLEDVERFLILASLKKFHGNKTSAATELGVTARTLNNKVNRYREEGFACAW